MAPIDKKSNAQIEVRGQKLVSSNQVTEVESREILEQAVKSEGRVKLGSLLAGISRQLQLADKDYVVLKQVRNQTSFESINFE